MANISDQHDKQPAAENQAQHPTTVVQRMFAAFQRADLDALIATVHPDSRWIYHGANPRLSHAEINGHAPVRKFFAGILARLDMTEFNMDEFIEQGDSVVIFGSEAGNIRKTGQPFRNEWAQKYVVRDGLIVAMAEYNIQSEPRS